MVMFWVSVPSNTSGSWGTNVARGRQIAGGPALKLIVDARS